MISFLSLRQFHLFIDPPKISPCSPKEVLSKLGNSVLFCCNASGYPPPRITWYEDADLIRGAESRELRLTNVTSSFHGQYKCRASNLAGFAEDVFSLAIEGKAWFEPFSKLFVRGLSKTTCVSRLLDSRRSSTSLLHLKHNIL